MNDRVDTKPPPLTSRALGAMRALIAWFRGLPEDLAERVLRHLAASVPALGVLAVCCLFLIVHATLATDYLAASLERSFGIPKPPAALFSLEQAKDVLFVRYAWGCATVAVFFFSLASLAHIVWNVVRRLRQLRALLEAVPALTSCLALIVALLFAFDLKAVFPDAPLAAPFKESFKHLGMSGIDCINVVMNGTAAVYLLVLTVGAVTTAHLSHRAKDIAAVASLDAHLRWMLYGGAAILTSAVFEIAFVHQLALPAHPAAEAKALQHLSTTVAGGAGFILSLFLLAIYLPAALQVRHAAKCVAANARIPASRTTNWLGEHNINVSLWHSVGQFLITAAPILGSAFLAGLGKGK